MCAILGKFSHVPLHARSSHDLNESRRLHSEALASRYNRKMEKKIGM